MSTIRNGMAAALLCAIGTMTVAVAQDRPGASPEASKAEVKRSVPDGPFLARPYVQLGPNRANDRLVLIWHAADIDADWSVMYRPGLGTRWECAGSPEPRRVVLAGGIEPHRVYRATLTGLEPGVMFEYTVMRGAEVVFRAEARAPKAAGQAQRFVVFGDCGAGTADQKAIAYRAFLSRPDYLVIPGDIVYSRGLASEYREKFWPVYNADEPSPHSGAPLLRSTPFVAAPGNHDIGSRDLGKNPDGLAYFYYWSQPLNGPEGREGGPMTAPLVGPEANRKAFLDAAGAAFPRMANFSFDYGDVHWTVLDANVTVDWTDPGIRGWVERDLDAAKGATWRFVCFHQPGFNSSRTHFDEQYMRVLAPVFEAGRVDLVFTGHVHNYQRSYPLRFVPAVAKAAAPVDGKNGRPSGDRHVDGRWTLDRRFDGQADTTPEGVIYLVTGAGGQHLYNPEQQDNPASWQEFTFKHISKVFSFTIVDLEGRRLLVRQVTPDGAEVDAFAITK